MSRKSDNRIYVGNLPTDVRIKDIEELFFKYGKISFVDLKNRKGPPFAFIEFEDARDAEDAVEGRDGYNFEGHRLKVEFQKGSRADFNDVGRFGRNGSNARRSEYRCIITGLPPTGSWQDLKDHMREAGNVCYADVFKDGTGVVEFSRYEDMKYAARVLDDSKFRSHEGETSYIRVRMDPKYNKSVSRSRSRSRSSPRRSVRASPTYSPMRRTSRSRTRTLSRSSYRSRSRTRSQTRTRSVTRSPTRSRSRSRSRSLRRSKSAHKTSRSRSRSHIREKSKSVE